MERPALPGGAYGVQVLIAGRQKHWRDEISALVRRAGYAATTVDSGVDAMTVLALGLPVDVLVTDVGLRGTLCCQKLAQEARALRPDLRIVFASDVETAGDETRATPCLDKLFGGHSPTGDGGLIAFPSTDRVVGSVRQALRDPA